jgi:hypothetical protein
MKHARHRAFLLTALLATSGVTVSGCVDGEVETGTLRVTVYGEEFVEDRIPASEVADGWTIEFQRFLVSVDRIAVDGTPLEGPSVFDLALPSGGEGHEVGALEVRAGDVTEVEYDLAPATLAGPGNVTETDTDLMNESGASLYVQGVAMRGGDSIRFAWSFDVETSYACEIRSRVPARGEVTTELTIHADHLFHDDLELPEPNVAFNLVASADTDGDGVVTREELAEVDIRALDAYQVGGRDITDLWGFISAQAATIAHIDGEGHCDTAPRIR